MNLKLIAFTLALGAFGREEAAHAAERAPVRIDINTQGSLPPVSVVPFNVSEEGGQTTVALLITSMADTTQMTRVRVRVGEAVTTNARTLVVTSIQATFVTVQMK